MQIAAQGLICATSHGGAIGEMGPTQVSAEEVRPHRANPGPHRRDRVAVLLDISAVLQRS
jgi:hypothetical protein